MNLLEPVPFAEKMDLILCRNVAIYFQPHDKRKMFSQFFKSLNPHGFLVLGTTENLHDGPQVFREKKVGKAVFYQPLEQAEKESLHHKKIS